MADTSKPELRVIPKADPFDPASFQLSPDDMAGPAVAEQALINVPVRKPLKAEFFRVTRTTSYTVATALLEHDRDFFLVERPLRPALRQELKTVQLFICMSRLGTVFLWPIRLPAEDGKDNQWWLTARTIAQTARQEWVRCTPDRDCAGYVMTTAASGSAGAEVARQIAAGSLRDRLREAVHRQPRPPDREAPAGPDLIDGLRPHLGDRLRVPGADGANPEPVCMCAVDVLSGRRLRLWEHELSDLPLRYRARLALRRLLRQRRDLLLPRAWLAGAGPHPRSLRRVSRPHQRAAPGLRERPARRHGPLRPRPYGAGGEAALRDRILAGPPWSRDDRDAILDYCIEDVEATRRAPARHGAGDRRHRHALRAGAAARPLHGRCGRHGARRRADRCGATPVAPDALGGASSGF